MNTDPPSFSTPVKAKETAETATLLDSILSSADAYYAQEDWQAARDCLCHAVELAPKQPQIRAALGSLQFRLRDYSAACASFTSAISACPENPDLHIQLAMVHRQLKQADEAKAALQRSLSLRPNNSTARRMLGDLDFAAKRYADAAQHYCALLESNPDGVNLLLHLGKCEYELRDLDSARWCFKRVIVLEPTNAIAAEALELIAANPQDASRNELLKPIETEGRRILPASQYINLDFLELSKEYWSVQDLHEAMFKRICTDSKIDQMPFEKQLEAWNISAIVDAKRVTENIPTQPGWKILEIGCGVGRIIKPLRERYAAVDGVDISEKMIEFARVYLSDGSQNGEVCLNSGADVRMFADNTYDLVFSMIVFQHIRSVSVVRSYLHDILRVLKPAGYFRLQVYESNSRNNPQAGLFNEEAKAGVQYEMAGNTYTPEQLRTLLEDQGYKITQVTQQTPWIWATSQKPAGVTESPHHLSSAS